MNKKEYLVENSIYFWRIIFTCLIALLHFNNVYSLGYSRFNIVGGQYIAVEFFFIVSGYLMYKSFSKASKKSSFFGQYNLKRFKRLFPIFISALIVNFIFYCYFNHLDFKSLCDLLHSCFFEFFMLHMAGLNNQIIINGPGWYVSALLISGFIVSYFLAFHEKTYKRIIMPLSIMIIYSYFYRMQSGGGGIGVYALTEGVYLNHAIMRAIAGINLGILAFDFSNIIKEKQMNVKLLTVLETLLYALIIFSMFKTQRNNADFIKIFLLFLAISISFSHPIYTGKMVKSALVKLSAITYSVYLTHNIFRSYLFPMFFPTTVYSLKILTLYFIIIFIYGFLFDRAVQLLGVCFKDLYTNFIKRNHTVS